MFSTTTKFFFRNAPAARFIARAETASATTFRFKSTQASLDEGGDLGPRPDTGGETSSLLMPSEKYPVGYLSKILSAKVYDAAVETELQEAENLSSVSPSLSKVTSPLSTNLSHRIAEIGEHSPAETRGYTAGVFVQNPWGLQQNGKFGSRATR